jgi:hypothetical protein
MTETTRRSPPGGLVGERGQGSPPGSSVARSRCFTCVLDWFKVRQWSLPRGSRYGYLLSPGIGKMPDPPDARAYDAIDGRLYSLHLSAGGASLNSLDVSGALEGMTTMQTVRVAGTVPTSPVAMVWNKGDKSLYVLDSSARNGGREFALLRLQTNGDATEVWRAARTARPVRAFLSAGYGNDLVVAVSTPSGSEVAAFDPGGAPLYSVHAEGRFQGPPIESAAGLTLPMLRDSGGQKSNLDLRFVSRSNLTPGVFDARWMRGHAWPRLGASCNLCRDHAGWGGGG